MKIDPVKIISDALGVPTLDRSDAPRVRPEINVKSLGEKQILFSWDEMVRSHKGAQQSSKATRTFTVIGIVIAFVLIILQEFFLLLVIGSMIFVSYVLTRTPPEKTTYTISTHGISIGEQIFYWPEMDRFFFTELDGGHILAVDLIKSPTPRLFLTYKSQDRDKIAGLLSEHLVQLEKEPKTPFDKLYESVKDKLNLS